MDFAAAACLQPSVRLTAPTRMPPLRESPGGEVTRLLRLWSEGDERAFEQVIPLVYDQLHRMARRYLVGDRARLSLPATGLVNEVCVRLLGWDQARWQNRQQFFGVSARMMRRVLVDIARRRAADRRGGSSVRVPLDQIDAPVLPPDLALLDLDRALDRLARHDPRKAQVVELHFFGGLSMADTADALSISLRTANSDWAFARAWLYQAMTDGGSE
jgi:RNA polymerase sigma factor (TIGR02999 family)